MALGLLLLLFPPGDFFSPEFFLLRFLLRLGDVFFGDEAVLLFGDDGRAGKSAGFIAKKDTVRCTWLTG